MQGVMKQVIFRPDQISALDDLASKFGVNRSVVVRWACDDLLKKSQKAVSTEEVTPAHEPAAFIPQPA